MTRLGIKGEDNEGGDEAAEGAKIGRMIERVTNTVILARHRTISCAEKVLPAMYLIARSGAREDERKCHHHAVRNKRRGRVIGQNRTARSRHRLSLLIATGEYRTASGVKPANTPILC